MPKYAYTCTKCKAPFDELFLSFSSAERAETENSVRCPKEECGGVAKKESSPDVAMVGSGFRKYGLYTYP